MKVNWSRRIDPRPASLELINLPVTGPADLRDWLESEAKSHSLTFMLAHADDGVVWGKVNYDGRLITSDQAASDSSVASALLPGLHSATVQQVRLFGPKAELFFWRTGDNEFRARLIVDLDTSDKGACNWKEAYDEYYFLWGTGRAANVTLKYGYTLLEQGAQGLLHAVPLSVDTSRQRVRLLVRNYLSQEDFARVEVSRLVDVGIFRI